MAKAVELREKAESQIRRTVYLEEFYDLGSLEPMPENVLNRIVAAVAGEFTIQQLATLEEQLGEVQTDYLEAMREAVFTYRFKDPAVKEQLSLHRIVEPPPPPAPPLFAIVKIPPHPFGDTLRTIEGQLFQVRALAAAALLQPFSPSLSTPSLPALSVSPSLPVC